MSHFPASVRRAPRRLLIYGLTFSFPIALLVILELVLRLMWAGGQVPVFDELEVAGRQYRVASRTVARRYFADEAFPPAPPQDYFLVDKPAHAFRVFVLGESTAAGFPYLANGTFSRVLRDALHDVLPGDSVEVINLGIAATNSYTLVDLVDEVIGQKPDAVLIYAGHNEYYGALGVGSTIRAGSSPTFVRAYLRLQRLRTAMLMRAVASRVVGAMRAQTPVDSTAATFMESVAANQQIELGSRAYNAGLAQYGSNVAIVLDRLRSARVPAFIASIASNERGQRPFAAAANGPARTAYDSAASRLGANDSSGAARLFARARDLDVVRFRAPSALDDTIRALAASHGAYFVPVAEAIRAASPAGSPGNELFLEHVHPNQGGYLLIARTFFESLREKQFLGRSATIDHLAPWTDYERRMFLSPLDQRIVHHTVQTVVTRWPFVPASQSLDYRGTYRPVDAVDSVALLVSRGGMSWGAAKLALGERYEREHRYDEALGEYAGLLRDRPLADAPVLLIGRTLFEAKRFAEALPYLERVEAKAPTWESAYMLGAAALEEKDFEKAIALLDRSATRNPSAAAPVYELSLAFGLSRNLVPARAAAARAAQLDPRYPGLGNWMTTLGMPAPAP